MKICKPYKEDTGFSEMCVSNRKALCYNKWTYRVVAKTRGSYDSTVRNGPICKDVTIIKLMFQYNKKNCLVFLNV